MDELIKLSKEIVEMDSEAKAMGLTDYEYAFYTSVANNDSAKELMDELDKLVQLFAKQLNDFDAMAKKSRQQATNAQAQIDLQKARQESQNQLAGLRASAGGTSTALGALNKRTQKLTEQAAGMKIVTDLAQKPLDQANEIDEIRRSVAQGSGAAETTMERLRRLSVAKTDVSVS